MKLKDFDYKLLFSVKVNLDVKRATTTTIKLGFILLSQPTLLERYVCELAPFKD